LTAKAVFLPYSGYVGKYWGFVKPGDKRRSKEQRQIKQNTDTDIKIEDG
jgi:hypothetical protein